MNNNQYGFLEEHSSGNATVEDTDLLCKKLYQGMKCLRVYVAKPFDIVPNCH